MEAAAQTASVLLRRLKKDVARELPPKIERVATCALSADQKKVYAALLENSRQRLSELVAAQGFARAKFEILQTLLRLRQACCHLDLLKLPDVTFDEPSSKLELFFELLDEAMDAGHRVLVFSQFVSMLTILRKALTVAVCVIAISTGDSRAPENCAGVQPRRVHPALSHQSRRVAPPESDGRGHGDSF